MKKVALIFVLAVLVPSLVLAWLAVRSLRDQQFLLERQQSLLYQRLTDALAQGISDRLAQQQQEFSAQVESLMAGRDAYAVAVQFDDQLRKKWPLAEVGFCVTLSGKILSPPPNARQEARLFDLENRAFLGNRESVEVYSTANFGKNFAENQVPIEAGQSSSANYIALNQTAERQPQPQRQRQQEITLAGNVAQTAAPVAAEPAQAPSSSRAGRPQQQQQEIELAKNTAQTTAPAAAAPSGSFSDTFAYDRSVQEPSRRKIEPANSPALEQPQQDIKLAGSAGQMGAAKPSGSQTGYNYRAQTRKVSPQTQSGNLQVLDKSGKDTDVQDNLSKVIPAEAEFSQLIGNETDGMLARFLQNKLNLMFWHRLSREPDLIFGAQLNLQRVVDGLRGLVQTDPALRDEVCIALLDDNAKPVALSRAGFQASWKRPFVATEIGGALPHWEVAAYLVNPARLAHAANTAKLTLGLLIAVLVLAIGVGSWLIVSSLNSELKLARQKTDFVGNVSHELKTPLTSIRMFSELLAEGRVADRTKQHSYLNIITAEAARLTRLINNVLDFSRMERGEKKYNFQPCDLVEVVRAAAQTFRPHLEAGGFKFDCSLPDTAIPVRGDADALSQIIVNLLSNAEKYSNGGKEITLQAGRRETPLPHAEVRVLDRGLGVPRGSEGKIFEKFYRAHDSLSSGVQGSGLGLTIARQIARAHGGDVVYEPREGGGSCFILRLPLKPIETANEQP
jgi:signal transduction histidine kinase